MLISAKNHDKSNTLDGVARAPLVQTKDLCKYFDLGGGAMLHAVSTRTHEIGIRIAVGAQPGQVLAMVLREGFVLSALGAGSGALLALAGGRFIASLLYGVQPFDAVLVRFSLLRHNCCSLRAP